MPSDVLLYQLLLVELTNALRNRDADAAGAVLKKMYTVQPNWTEGLVNFLIQEGLHRSRASHRSGLSD
ncbi:hypothetical protein GCM10009557_13870 [Virgisporangium ochraceum]|uniref:Uncharacterized protein n=1 Tax=Virgisporangium ochraceum TaxID=65505 RepID=A0A8J4EE19_9ACTN|nr:hypothetical protein [Virgisporangium ochraceum]GIJ71261.1 hypothetical protein Voc01_061780 [Virgisporangium ochraceum]